MIHEIKKRTKLIITSEQRVGSRWMHYLFSDLLENAYPAPELSGRQVYLDPSGTKEKVITFLREGRIPKFHGIGPFALDSFLKSFGTDTYAILGVVRNPYDRAVSFALHQRQKLGTYQREVDTDQEAVIWTVTEDEGFLKSVERQHNLMLPYYSTKLTGRRIIPYVWTSYEWLKEDTATEVSSICHELFLLDREDQYDTIKDVVKRHSFKYMSGRKAGVEDRSNEYLRKGVVGDHVNWFNEDCYRTLKKSNYRYRQAIANEIHNEKTRVVV